MLTLFYKFFIEKNIVVKVVFGDRVDVLNDFFYQPGGSMLLVKILCEALETLCKKSSIVTGIIFLRWRILCPSLLSHHWWLLKSDGPKPVTYATTKVTGISIPVTYGSLSLSPMSTRRWSGIILLHIKINIFSANKN